jgi:hypothetical protein
MGVWCVTFEPLKWGNTDRRIPSMSETVNVLRFLMDPPFCTGRVSTPSPWSTSGESAVCRSLPPPILLAGERCRKVGRPFGDQPYAGDRESSASCNGRPSRSISRSGDLEWPSESREKRRDERGGEEERSLSSESLEQRRDDERNGDVDLRRSREALGRNVKQGDSTKQGRRADWRNREATCRSLQ